MILSRVESDGTMQIPEQVCERLGLGAGDEVEFIVENGHVILRRRKEDIRKLSGVLSHLVDKPLSVEEMNEAIRRAAASQNS